MIKSCAETASSRSFADDTSTDFALAFSMSPTKCFALDKVRQAEYKHGERGRKTNCDVVSRVSREIIKRRFGNETGPKEEDSSDCQH